MLLIIAVVIGVISTFTLGMLFGYQSADNKWLRIDNERKDLINREYILFGDD